MNSLLAHLRPFYEVARLESFTKAAAALQAHQPAMSRSVRLLEEALGVVLIDRKGRKRVVLTSAGERVFERCKRIFSEVEQVERIGEDERGEVRGPLRLGSSGALASRAVPDALPALLARHSKLWPMVFAAPAALGMHRIAEKELEFGLYFYVPPVPAALEVVELGDVEFRFVIRARDAKNQAVRGSFLGSREVEDPKNRQFPTLDRLKQSCPEAAIRISTNDAEAHVRLVEAGQGCSILPAFVVGDGLEHGRLADVFPKERFRFPLLLVKRKNHVLTRGAEALCQQVASQICLM